MYPILARYGTFFLYTYTVVWDIGLLLGFYMLWRRAKRTNIAVPYDGLLWGIFAALIIGRASFVLGNWDYFQQNQGEIAQLWRGGIGYHAALLAGIELFFLVSLWQKKATKKMMWLIAPLLPWLSVVGWLACYAEGCAYGAETVLGLLSADLPDHLGVFAIRYQSQLLGVFGSLVALLLTLLLQNKLASSKLFWLSLALISLVHIGVTLLRADEMFLLFGQRLDIWLDVLLIVVGLGGIGLAKNDVAKTAD